MAEITLNDVLEKYIKLRDKKAELSKDFKERTEKIDAAMKAAEAALLHHFNTTGVESVGCSAGTAFKVTRTSATVGDWDATLDFIKANDAWHMLEKRVAKTAVEAYVEEHKLLPPGVKYTSDVTVQVRRS